MHNVNNISCLIPDLTSFYLDSSDLKNADLLERISSLLKINTTLEARLQQEGKQSVPSSSQNRKRVWAVSGRTRGGQKKQKNDADYDRLMAMTGRLE